MTERFQAQDAAGRKRTAGFMLVEMLVAMAVGAFLLIALAALTSFLLRVHDRTARAARENERTGRALALLSRDIGRALPVRWAGRKAPFVFSGSSAGLLFASQQGASGGLDEVDALRFETVRTGAAIRLVRFDGNLPPDAATAATLAWSPPADIYSGASGVAFAYYMRLDGGGEALLDDWPAGDEMPVAVRVSFLPASPDGQVLMQRIPLPIDTELACAAPDAEGCGGPDEPKAAGDDPPGAAPVEADDPLGWNRFVR